MSFFVGMHLRGRKDAHTGFHWENETRERWSVVGGIGYHWERELGRRKGAGHARNLEEEPHRWKNLDTEGGRPRGLAALARSCTEETEGPR